MKNLSIISFSVIIEGNQTGGTSLIFQAGPSVPTTLSVPKKDSEYKHDPQMELAREWQQK